MVGADDAWSPALARFPIGRRFGAWSLASVESGERDGRVLVFRNGERGSESVAVLVTKSDATRPAFARTRDVDVSYLNSFRGQRCGFDQGLIDEFVGELRRGEPA
jgi:hypothetical protein